MALKQYKCPNCDGGINFDATTQEMNCPFCDSTFDVAALKSYDEDLADDAPDEIEWTAHEDTAWQEGEQEGLRIYLCNTCAGEVIGDAVTAATSCPYCGNPVVMTGQLSGALKPDCIVPFKLDKAAAKQALARHLSDKKLLPRCFKSSKTLDEIKGIYVPFWLFDAEIDANMRYRTTTIRKWSDSRFHYIQTRHFNVTRRGNLAFDAVPVDASAKMPADLMESIEPFDTKQAQEFQTAFLSGYLADKFDFDSALCKERANQRIKASTEHTFRQTVTGYASVLPQYSGVYLKSSSVRYALLPVWAITATWRGETYLFAMNGQTGKFVGNLPTDWGIFWRWFGIWAAIIFVAINIILILAGVIL